MGRNTRGLKSRERRSERCVRAAAGLKFLAVNQLILSANDNRITVRLNGHLVTQMNLDDRTKPNQRPDGTRHKFDIAYKDHPRHGYIGLQDHGADCWFGNIGFGN